MYKPNTEFIKTYLLIAALLLCFKSTKTYAQEKTPILDCWVATLGLDFDFYGEMDKLEALLIQENVLKGNSEADYTELLYKLRLSPDGKQFEEIVKMKFKYVSQRAYKNCLLPNDIIHQNGKTLKYSLLHSLYLSGARLQHTMIYLKVSKDHGLTLEGEEVTLENFEKEVIKHITALVDKGVEKEEITLNLIVHPEVKMGVIVEIQAMLKNTGVKRIFYNAPK